MPRRWNSNLSLRAKAIGISVAITTLALFTVATVGMLQQKRQIAAEERRAAESMAWGLAHASELAAAVHDTRELSRLAGSFLRDENVLFIAAYGGGSQPLAIAVRDGHAWDLYQRGLTDPRHCVVATHSLEPLASGNDFSEEAAGDPLAATSGDGAKVAARPAANPGRVVIGLSTAAGLAAQNEQGRLMIVATLLAALAGAMILSLTLGSWLRRLKQVADASHLISRGDFTASIVDARKDEIGTLSRSFEAMRLALRERDLKLRGFTDTLQEQVKERTRDLETALTAAEQASRAKSLFLANMSHELRTPLNGVIGMVDLLLTTDPNSQQKRYCEVAKSSARSLLELINDILDFSKIEAGKLELDCSEFDLHGVVESVVQMISERAEKKKLELVCSVKGDVPRTVAGDSTRLRQVILNLASNAIKFTDHGEVVISAVLESETATHAVVRFSVRDNGIGIAPDRMSRLFQSFSQIDASTTRKYGGTGLGLAISQRIVEMMGGQIGVDSIEGQGSTFWFTVRVEKRVQQVPVSRDTRVDPRGRRVLVVDDSAINREILQAQLTSWELRADVAASSSAALGMLKAAFDDGEPYQIALLDMHMPGMDGAELARMIKSDPLTWDIILISLSSLSDRQSATALTTGGFSACLTKPALPSQLFDAIVESLSVREQGKPAAASTPSGDDAALRLPGVRVLLAEDNEVNRLVASELLMLAGCHCTMAVNGREAVEHALSGEFDVILMDCQMPIMDGYAATRMIRNAEKNDLSKRHRPIVALTANAIKGDREVCLAAGMDGYVTKPIEPLTLMKTIRSFLPATHTAAAPAPATNNPTIAALPRRVEQDAPSTPALTSTPSNTASQALPIDVASLQRRCMGNRKIAAKALSKFDSTVLADFSELSGSVKRGDAKSAAAMAHKIKGAAANVSAGELHRIATELDALLKSDELSQVQTCVDQFRKELDRFHGYVSTALGELAPAESRQMESVQANPEKQP